ncbi:MAG TPA: sigma-70 family RNA polymerase sigma factor [Pyrinomonadaceae bacterium]|nr:sigma-70 family RNA polymerase sigma factor [Pyrinomonadaceae bacterium]
MRTEHSGREREADLITWIARGDAGAFREFYEATNGLLFGLLLRILGHTQTAEEVLSELYEEVRQKAARFGRQTERPLTWLIFMAHRRAIECLCRKLRTQSQTASTINITEQRRLIREAMDSIPDLHQQMIEMAFFAGMTNHEIAKELGQTPERVEANLRNAMLRLFQLFSAMGFSPLNTTETEST